MDDIKDKLAQLYQELENQKMRWAESPEHYLNFLSQQVHILHLAAGLVEQAVTAQADPQAERDAAKFRETVLDEIDKLAPGTKSAILKRLAELRDEL